MSFLRKTLAALAGIHDTPQRTAAAFSLGVFLAFSPLLGLHTVLGILLAFVLRLNRLAVLLGVWTNLPWFLVPYYAFATWLGIRLLGAPASASLPLAGFSDVWTPEFWNGVAAQWRLLLPAFVGSSLLAGLFAAAAYPLALVSVQRFRRRQRRVESATDSAIGPAAGAAAHPQSGSPAAK